ncbi:hypothetical protein ACFC0C_36260 [Streptomyces sp. NPDC056178]|uniref:hypothetical protein n=1 Tax=unclassified Streptomyces TaxID=2593676 RepID=UPI0035DB4215
MAHGLSQAALALNSAEGSWGQGGVLAVGSDLLDDGVVSVFLFGLECRCGLSV